jgi:hypothetical protein
MVDALTQRVFVSHAGADSAQAVAVADILTGSGIGVRFDRKELCLGDSFLSFMDSALADSDYCLLLWSRNAAQTPWVRMEWESALYRSIQEKRAFLVTGRLEDAAIPSLLAPRLRVDLFPELEPGIGQIAEMWGADRNAESATQRPVAGSKIGQPEDSGPNTVYVTSEAFGITVPVRVDLNAPAGLMLDRIITRAALPKVLQYEGRIGVRFTYTLMNGEEELDRAKSLAQQGVADRSVVWLKTRMTQFSDAAPLEGSVLNVTFRKAMFEASDPMIGAREEYRAAIRQAHLGA